MNAAKAWRDAGLMPNPPKDEGREAFVQAQSVKGQPTRSDTASLMVSSNSSRAFWIRGGGQVRSRCAILGRERQKRRRAVSIWESSRSPSLKSESLTLLILTWANSRQKVAAWAQGRPRECKATVGDRDVGE